MNDELDSMHYDRLTYTFAVEVGPAFERLQGSKLSHRSQLGQCSTSYEQRKNNCDSMARYLKNIFSNSSTHFSSFS